MLNKYINKIILGFFILLLAVLMPAGISLGLSKPAALKKIDRELESTTRYPNTPAKDFGADAPWVHRSGLDAQIPIIAFIKDANLDNLLLDYVAFYNESNGQLIAAYNPDPNITITDDFFWVGLNNLTPNDLSLGIGDTAKIKVVIRFRDQLIWNTYNFHLQTLIAEPWPEINNWQRGDFHYHSLYTEDLFEFGGYWPFSAEAAKDIGLDFTMYTDHSYDVSPNEWEEMKDTAVNLSDQNFTIIPGMEFSADTNDANDLIDDRIHLLGFGFDQWISGPEIIPGLDNYAERPRSLQSILSDIDNQGGISFAAHPEYEVTAFGQWGVIDPWDNSHYQIALQYPSFLGLQIFNTRSTSIIDTQVTTDNMNPFPWTFNQSWDDSWLQGIGTFNQLVRNNINRNLSMAGGSDAHGDANYQTFNNYGYFDVAAVNNAYGKIHTAVYSPDNNPDNILSAIRQGRLISTDGPLATMIVHNNNACWPRTVGYLGDRITYNSSDIIVIQAKSSPEFNEFQNLKLHILSENTAAELVIPINGYDYVTTRSLSELAPQSGDFAIWLESKTIDNYRSFSNPIWFDRDDYNGGTRHNYAEYYLPDQVNLQAVACY